MSNWFFARGDPRTAAALRIGYSVLVLLILWDFYPVMPLLFGHRGMMGTMEPVLQGLSGFQYFLFRHDSPLELQLWFWISVLFAVFAMVGFLTRLSLLTTFLSMMLFRERGPFLTFGADLVINCIGVWLLFLNCGETWSIDKVLRRRNPSGIARQSIEHWPVKAIQIQVALIYLVTGLKKLQTTPWQDGSAVYYALHVGSVLKGHPEPWVIHHHWLMAFMNYGTLAIELAAPVVLFIRPMRFWAMLAAVCMHTGIDIFMSIRFFSLAMYLGYAAFLDEKDWMRCAAWICQGKIKILKRRSSTKATAASQSTAGFTSRS